MCFGAAQAIEVLFRTPRRELRFGELGLAFALEVAEVILLHPLVIPVLLERLLQMDETVTLARQLIAELLDARDERTVVQCEEMQILVTGNELAEGLGRE